MCCFYLTGDRSREEEEEEEIGGREQIQIANNRIIVRLPIQIERHCRFWEGLQYILTVHFLYKQYE